jgi:hypothetical protein
MSADPNLPSDPVDAVEEALKAQAYAFAERGGYDDRLQQMVMTAWIGVSSWSGVNEDGDEVTRVVCHLRDSALSTWQLIGLLRAQLLTLESDYTA